MTPATVAAAPSIFRDLRLAAADIKLAHSVFAFPYAILACFLARPDSLDWARFAAALALIAACMVTARTWAMLYNRIADRRIDAANPRTQRRAVASGALATRRAWVLAAGSAALFIAFAAGFRPLLGKPLAAHPRRPRPRLDRLLQPDQALHLALPSLPRRRPRREPRRRRPRHRTRRPGTSLALAPRRDGRLLGRRLRHHLRPAGTSPSTARKACTAPPAASASPRPSGSAAPSTPPPRSCSSSSGAPPPPSTSSPRGLHHRGRSAAPRAHPHHPIRRTAPRHGLLHAQRPRQLPPRPRRRRRCPPSDRP
jgi:ABC-type nickel/cobalt efflux system permease component RcnA